MVHLTDNDLDGSYLYREKMEGKTIKLADGQKPGERQLKQPNQYTMNIHCTLVNVMQLQTACFLSHRIK